MGAEILFRILIESLFYTQPENRPQEEIDPNTKTHISLNIGADANGYNVFGMGLNIVGLEEKYKARMFVDFKIPREDNSYWADEFGFDFQNFYFNNTLGIGGGASMISQYGTGARGYSIPLTLSYRVCEHLYLDFKYSLFGAYYLRINRSEATEITSVNLSPTEDVNIVPYSSMSFSLEYLF